MNIVLTGNEGFIGKNLEINLSIEKNINLYLLNRKTSKKKIKKYLGDCDVSVHAAGVNRSKNKNLFNNENFDFTRQLLNLMDKKKEKKILFFSSSKFNEKTEYGLSKRKAENFIKKNSKLLNYKYFIFRFPNVFGKWCKPNYNSFLSTIFFNIVRNKKIKKISPTKKINLVYIDDVIELTSRYLKYKGKSKILNVKGSKYNLKKLCLRIENLWKDYQLNMHDNTATGFDRKLFSTMISYLPVKDIVKKMNGHIDKRGSFYEFLKTKKSGQFSFFTINKNKERGGHFHNTKNEKFVILYGKVNFKANNLSGKETFSKVLTSEKLCTISSLPGWVHTFKNIGNTKAIVAVWANETLNKLKMDTYKF